MPLYKNNVVFIHIPKTGGTYIEKTLNQYVVDNLFGYSNELNAYLQHCYFSEYKHLINKTGHYNYFSIIRNPYDRLYSAYKQKFNELSDKHLVNMMESDNFKDFVMNKLEKLLSNTSEYRKYKGNIRHISKQIDFLDKNSNIVQLFLYEHISDISDYLKKYDICATFVFNNENESYKTHYDEEMISKIEKIYEEDIAIYNSLLQK